MNNLVIQEYICANSKITQNYFTFVDRILDLLHETPQKREILERLLSQTEEITNKFLETNQQLLSFSSNQSIILEEFDENLVKASISENQQNHEPKNIHQKINSNLNKILNEENQIYKRNFIRKSSYFKRNIFITFI